MGDQKWKQMTIQQLMDMDSDLWQSIEEHLLSELEPTSVIKFMTDHRWMSEMEGKKIHQKVCKQLLFNRLHYPLISSG
jgi:hypothetical protein